MTRKYLLSEAGRARRSDPAVRAKISAASKAALADPAVRAKMSAASKAAWADPAVRAKMSAARKAAWAGRRTTEIERLLPDQVRIYDVLRKKGCTHAEAIREACQPRCRVAAA